MSKQFLLGLLFLVTQESFQFSTSLSSSSNNKLHGSAPTYYRSISQVNSFTAMHRQPPQPVISAQISGHKLQDDHLKLLSTAGGAVSCPKSKFGLASCWGVLGVLSVVFNAVKRLLPVALEPFSNGNVGPTFWGGYILFSLFMAYTEGYKAFQKKFSPLVVKRALTLDKNPTPVRILFAAPYSMGMFHATKKRKIVSWGITFGVFILVQIVKKLPYPYRSLVDAGVVAGLSWGGISIVCHYIRSICGTPPDIDPALPKKE